MNPLQMIFGGSTSQSSGSSTGQSTSNATNYNPFTSVVAQPVGSLLTGAAGAGAPQYSGPTSLGTTAAQRQTLSTLPGMVAPNSTANSYINNVLSGSYMPGGANGNPFLQSNIAASVTPIQESLQNTLTQSDPLMFQGAGHQEQGDSSLQTANAIASEGAANAEAQVATSLGSNAYTQGVNQMNTAIQVQPQEVQATINTLQAQLLPTLLKEQGITNGLQSFQENIGALTSFLQTLVGSATPVLGNNAQSTNSATQQSTGDTQGNAFSSLFPTTTSSGSGGLTALLGLAGV